MTRTPIIVWIEPDADGVHCGKCRGLAPENPEADEPGYCPWCEPRMTPYPPPTRGMYFVAFRGPACLAAMKMMADLVEAGDDLRQCSCAQERSVWDATLAAMKEGSKS